ncbi:MAG: hypothetical protein DSZ03_05080 [Sulfurimonas sp.]|nr:MAG: hypothetical protein DSZ03_05080 [Sulfurimonas sp.]
MKTLIKIYKEHRDAIKKHIFDTINAMERNTLSEEELRRFFPLFHSLQSIYAVNSGCNQITPLYLKEAEDTKRMNRVVTSLRENISLDENGEYMSSVYLSSTDGRPTVTASKQISDNEVMILNFNVLQLLEELHYIDKADFFNTMSKMVYAAIGYSLSFFAVILIFYALFNFVYYALDEGVNIFQSIFKSTIALTLGLAIFDLAKNLLEHEVVYKEHFKESHGSKVLLEKFLISIIIALSIEALMTVFKIALADYRDIIYAVYLILAVSVMIAAMSFLTRTTRNGSESCKND